MDARRAGVTSQASLLCLRKYLIFPFFTLFLSLTPEREGLKTGSNTFGLQEGHSIRVRSCPFVVPFLPGDQ